MKRRKAIRHNKKPVIKEQIRESSPISEQHRPGGENGHPEVEAIPVGEARIEPKKPVRWMKRRILRITYAHSLCVRLKEQWEAYRKAKPAPFGLVSALIAILPILLLFWQTTLVRRQVSLMDEQYLTARRTILLDMLYTKECGENAASQVDCPLKYNRRVRAEALAEFIHMEFILGKPIIDIRDCDLSGMELSSVGTAWKTPWYIPSHEPRIDLSGSNLRDSTFRNAYLRQSILAKAILDGVHIVDSDFSLSDLSYTSLKKASISSSDMTRVSFESADVRETTFEKVHLEAAVFAKTDLRNASFEESELDSSNFSAADIRGAYFYNDWYKSPDFSRAIYDENTGWQWRVQVDLSKAYFITSGARLDKAVLGSFDLSGIDLNYASLIGADLYEGELNNAVLTQVVLTNATLLNANLTNAYLQGANLVAADLRSARLQFADLAGADLTGARAEKVDLRDAKLSGAKLMNTDLREADLSDSILWGADMTRANLTGARLCGAKYDQGTRWPENFSPEWTGAVPEDASGWRWGGSTLFNPCDSTEDSPTPPTE